MRIFSFSPFGYEGSLVSVEVDLRRGIPAIDIVGLADGAVKEARERMRAAICNAGFEFPPERVLISLSPADLKKEGAGFDLAIALAVLQAKKKLSGNQEKNSSLNEKKVLVMGELELCGKIRPVRAVHAAAATAMAAGIDYCIIPWENFCEAMEVPGMKACQAGTLEDAFAALDSPERFSSEKSGKLMPEPSDFSCYENIGGVFFPRVSPIMEFAEVRGQDFLVRGLQIAAAGGHNLLAFGSPGCGKTMALEKFQSLLPLLTPEESRPVARIYSIADMLPPEDYSMIMPPFRMPHQTATIEGMCGGGCSCRPGEISLAHNGVLFLDEAAEFRTSVLQMLRVPLESGSITLSRAGRTSVYPANFQLIMASNPCPCGNFGSKDKICLCSSRSVEQYWKHFSGPLLDRIDMRIHVDAPSKTEKSHASSTSELRKKIAVAVKIQRERQGKKNSRLLPDEIFNFCKLPADAQKLLDNAVEKYAFSPRGVASCLKIARTIADMEDLEEIKAEHVQEAVLYRKNTGGMEFSGDA